MNGFYPGMPMGVPMGMPMQMPMGMMAMPQTANTALTQPAVSGGLASQVTQESLQQRSLWIGDIDSLINESYLQSAFASYGITDIVNIRIIRERATGQPCGYGFVEFASAQGATAALQICGGKPIPGIPNRSFRLNHASSTAGTSSTDPQEYQAHVSGLAPEVTETLLYQIFHERYSSVRGAKLIIDPATGLSRGFAFIRFASDEERMKAIEELNGSHICGRPIRVTTATSRRDTNPGANGALTPAATAALYGDDEGLTTLYIGSLNSSVTEDQLKKIFGQYGELVSVKVVPDKCCGFVQFAKRMNAEAGFVMDKQMVGGSRIRISWSHTQLMVKPPPTIPRQPSPTESTPVQQQPLQQAPQQAQQYDQAALYAMYMQYYQMYQSQQQLQPQLQSSIPQPSVPTPATVTIVPPPTSISTTTAPAQSPIVTAPTVQLFPNTEESLRKDDLSIPMSIGSHNTDYCRRVETQLYIKKQLRLP